MAPLAAVWMMDHGDKSVSGEPRKAVATLQVRDAGGLDPEGNDASMRRGQIPGVF